MLTMMTNTKSCFKTLLMCNVSFLAISRYVNYTYKDIKEYTIYIFKSV